MPKRKAKDVGETEEPRRSSRRISTKPDDAAPEPSAKVLAKKAKKASKKGLKAPEEDEPVVNFKDEQEPDSVGCSESLYSMLASRLKSSAQLSTSQSRVSLFYIQHSFLSSLFQ